jgi:hypothetical protein
LGTDIGAVGYRYPKPMAGLSSALALILEEFQEVRFGKATFGLFRWSVPRNGSVFEPCRTDFFTSASKDTPNEK